MVYCCVPQCGTDSWRCDPSITFHDFPSNPDLAAKWIQQVNSIVKSECMWFPRGKPVICSKHFLSTDYKDDSDALKPRVVPTVFGYKYIGQNPEVEEIKPNRNFSNTGPLIVKIKTENDNRDNIVHDSYSEAKALEAIINEPENSTSNYSQNILKNSSIVFPKKNRQTYSKMGVKHQNSRQIFKNNINSNKPLSLKFSAIEKNVAVKRNVQKRDNNDNNLIEIGPNTFLKINPDIIKVNKKQTPSGNTVLQFLMDQKLANTIGADVLPKIVQGAMSNIGNLTTNMMKNKSDTVQVTKTDSIHSVEKSGSTKKDTVVQHVLGHLVDTHICKESCAKLQEIDNNFLMETDSCEQESAFNSTLTLSEDSCLEETKTNLTSLTNQQQNKISTSEAGTTSNVTESNALQGTSDDKADSTCIAKAPVLLTTNMSLAHCFMEKTKYLSHLRQKSRQIASLKQKVSNLNKKIEELEDKCIVQERQLSFSFLKRLRTIRKNASRGDPPATYILEQIRAYTGQKQIRWSDSTLNQCAIWCRKAPYAYEYFKKADFFKLPCLGTVKRFMRKHPEMAFANKSVPHTGGDNDESSSDFDFDEEDSVDGKDKETNEEPIVCETVLIENNSNSGQAQPQSYEHSIMNHLNEQSFANNNSTMEIVMQKKTTECDQVTQNGNEVNSFPITVDGSSLELQELILPSGEVVQCYSSNICNGDETGNQYYIIPNAGDQNSGIDHEYSIVQSAESVPVILQNLDSSQLHQEQLIFITNSSEQVECTETEVVTA